MGKGHWVLVVVLAAQVVCSRLQQQNGGEEEGGGEFIRQSSNRAGCILASHAETISEEIAKLLATAQLVETSTSLFSTLTELPLIESCGSTNFENNFGAKVQQILSKAANVEEKINQANKKKEQQDHLAEKLLEIWKKIKRISQQHQKILNSLDMFAKDSVLQKAAQIELETRKDPKQWTVDSIKEALLKELSKAKTVKSILGEKILKTMERPLSKIIEYFVVSQMYASLRSTDLYDVLDHGPDNFRYGFSQVGISRGIRNTLNMKYGTMVTGQDEVYDYVSKVNDTLKVIRTEVDNLNSINEKMSCTERKRIGSEAIKSMENIIKTLDTTLLETATQYLGAAEKHGTGFMMPLLTERTLGSGLAALFFTLPEYEHRTPQLKTASLVAGLYGIEARGVKSIHEALELVMKTFPHLETITRTNRCYTKTFVAIGKFIQKCADGEGTFDEIYYGVMGNLKMDRFKCHRVSGLRFPFKFDVEGIVKRAAEKFGFNKDCTSNKQQDQPTTKFAFYHDSNDEDEELEELLSPNQRFTVCDLRSKSKSQSQIASMIGVEHNKVEAVRCKA